MGCHQHNPANAQWQAGEGRASYQDVRHDAAMLSVAEKSSGRAGVEVCSVPRRTCVENVLLIRFSDEFTRIFRCVKGVAGIDPEFPER
jgi:hypothetical protein